MTTFHPFRLLPFELRARIWELTLEPRTVEVRLLHKDTVVLSDGDRPSDRRLFSPTPVPATLQACQEARNQGLYQQAFYELAAVRSRSGFSVRGTPVLQACQEARNQGEQAVWDDGERRYVWVNLEVDMISIGKTALEKFKSVAPMIKRLKFERENSENFFYYWESKKLRNFVNVEEVHVVCADGWRAWHGASDDHCWHCGKENLFFINPDDGRMMRSIEMDDMFDQMLEEGYRREDEAERQADEV